jgi:hypothetical protein
MMIIRAILALFLTLCSIMPLAGYTLAGSSGFAIPFGTWATHHAPSPYLTFEIDLYEKRALSTGISLEMASFRGKLNSNYHLQTISPGLALTLYPLSFIEHRSLFIKGIASYSFMQRNLHEASEKGRDFSLLSAMGYGFKIAEAWGVLPYFGEKHYFGGIDMFTIGLEITYTK